METACFPCSQVQTLLPQSSKEGEQGSVPSEFLGKVEGRTLGFIGTLTSMDFSVVFASCDITTIFQEILLDSVTLFLGQLSLVMNCLSLYPLLP